MLCLKLSCVPEIYLKQQQRKNPESMVSSIVSTTPTLRAMHDKENIKNKNKNRNMENSQDTSSGTDKDLIYPI